MMKNELLNKLSVAACALLLAGTVTACGDSEPEERPCADGEELLQLSSDPEAKCYTLCPNGDGDCSMGQSCRVTGGRALCRDGGMTACPTGEINSTYQGSTQCRVDCSSDAALCTGDEQCVDADAGARVCATPMVTMPTCADGEVETTYQGGTRQCYKTCETTADCGDAALRCNPDTGGVNNICVMASELEQICSAYCATIYGDTCLDANCPGLTAAQKDTRAFNEETCLNGNPQFQAPLGLPCVERLAGTTEIAQLENTIAREAAALGCDSSSVKLRQSFSQFMLTAEGARGGGFPEECGAKPDPDINKSCATDADCNTGLISGSCQMVDGQGFCGLGACQTLIPDMQRQQIISQMSGLIAPGDDAGCGENTYCLVQAQGQQLASGCEEACQTNADCRFGVTGDADSGFACALGSLVTSGNSTLRVGFCEPACATDDDCPAVMVNGMAVERLCGNTRVCEETCVATDMMACRTAMGTQYATCTVSTRDAEKASCHNATLEPLNPPM